MKVIHSICKKKKYKEEIKFIPTSKNCKLLNEHVSRHFSLHGHTPTHREL